MTNVALNHTTYSAASTVVGPSAITVQTENKRDVAPTPPRNVLFISYAFPPTGGGGVQRPAKFAKYLPSCGWQPTVLTVANPSVPVSDGDLAGELDPKMTVLRARTWEPGYGIKKQLTAPGPSGRASLRSIVRRFCMRFLQPDPQVLWNGPAKRLAIKSIRENDFDAIFVTGPPFSSFLLGCQLKRRFGLPLILDFRDEWLLACKFFENHQNRGAAYRKQYAMMRKVLEAADAVITTTEASRQELAKHCNHVGSKAAVRCIYNGFDPDDLCKLAPRASTMPTPAQARRLRIVYTGTLWRLTDISPLVEALLSLQQLSKEQASTIELILAGRITPEQQHILAGLDGSNVSVIRHDYLPHREALQLAATADFLLLLLADEDGAERVVPAKLFEYLALRKPILAINAAGEAGNLVRAHGAATVFQPHEIAELTAWLDRLTKGWPASFSPESPKPGTSITQFSRCSLTSQLAAVLEDTISRPAIDSAACSMPASRRSPEANQCNRS